MQQMARRRILMMAIALEGGLHLSPWALGIGFEIPVFTGFQVTWEALGLGALAILPLLAGLGITLRSKWTPFHQLRMNHPRTSNAHLARAEVD